MGVEGVDVNFEDEDGDSPLEAAVKENQKSTVDILLKSPSINKDVNKLSELLISANKIGREKVVESLLTVEGVNANHKDEDGSSALKEAFKNGRKSVVKTVTDLSDLKVAVITNNLQEVKGLLPKHESINKAELGELLLLSAWQGNFDTINYLLTVNDADVSYNTGDGENALV